MGLIAYRYARIRLSSSVFIAGLLQQAPYLVPRRRDRRFPVWPRQRHQIIRPTQTRSREPESLFHHPADSIAVNRARQVPFRHAHCKACSRQSILGPHYYEPATVASRSMAQRPKATLLSKPSATRQPSVDDHTASRARPFARRARNTARPPRVLSLARNPCVRCRRVLEG
jgi:hypothetical protein